MPWQMVHDLADFKPLIAVLDKADLLQAVKVIIGGVPAALNLLRSAVVQAHGPNFASIPEIQLRQVWK